jgi:hypothetical protein
MSSDGSLRVGGMSGERRRLRWAAYLVVAGLAALAVWVVVTAAQGRWAVLALGVVLGLLTYFGPLWLEAACVVVALVLGQWWLAAILGVCVAGRAVPRLVPVSAMLPERDDAALARAVAQLPPEVAARLRDEGGAVVSTVRIVELAAAERHDIWENAVIGTPDPDDGARLLIDGQTWTSCAAEAVAFGGLLCQERGVAVSLQALAASAVLLPECAAAGWLNPGHLSAIELVASIVELDDVRIAQTLRRFVTSVEGADAMRRIEARLRADRRG